MIPLPEPLLVENMAARSAPQARVNVQSGSESLVAVSTPTVVPSKEAVQMPRDIVYRFYQLSWMQRLRIAMELGLYSDEDADVDEAEMGRRVFLRASERDGLHDLGAAIDRDLAQTPT